MECRLGLGNSDYLALGGDSVPWALVSSLEDGDPVAGVPWFTVRSRAFALVSLQLDSAL